MKGYMTARAVIMTSTRMRKVWGREGDESENDEIDTGHCYKAFN
jgi:hypothetical protein